MTKWFADEILESLHSKPGSRDREQIYRLIKHADKFQLSDSLTAQIAQTALKSPDTIAEKLPDLTWNHDDIWVEYPHRVRTEKTEIDYVGCLLSRDPYDIDHVAIFVAWKTSGSSIYHSYALLHWRLSELVKKQEISDIEEYLISLCRISIPTGLREEMEILEGIKAANDPKIEKAIKQTQADALGENSFLLGLILMLNTNKILFQDEDILHQETTKENNDSDEEEYHYDGIIKSSQEIVDMKKIKEMHSILQGNHRSDDEKRYRLDYDGKDTFWEKIFLKFKTSKRKNGFYGDSGKILFQGFS